MWAVRCNRSGDETAISPLARWVRRPRLSVTANDNRAPVAALDPVALLLMVGWRMTMGVCGLGMIAACACLFVVASPYP